MITNLERYERIARFYDLLDLPFEWRRYRALRPLLFQNLAGQLLDAGIGTGRNCAIYPPDAIVSGICRRCGNLAESSSRAGLSGFWNMCGRKGRCAGSSRASGSLGSRGPMVPASIGKPDKYLPAAGFELHESRYVVEDLVKLICARVPAAPGGDARACIDVQESGVIRPSSIHPREGNNG